MEQHNQKMRKAAGKIEGCWSRHRDRQMFQLLKTAVQQTDESTTYEIMRKINPKEAKLIQDSVFNAKIRFRFSGEEFPPFVVFKIFVQSKGVRFMTGKKTIKADTQAAVDACALMGNRTFLDQIISDMCVEDHNKITDDFEVVTVNDCMKVISFVLTFLGIFIGV